MTRKKKFEQKTGLEPNFEAQLGLGLKIEAIKNSTILGNLADELISKLAEAAQSQGYQKGQSIFFQGDQAKGFYLVTAGQVRIFHLDPEGRERALHLCGPGTIFGAAGLFNHKGYPASAEALMRAKTLFFPSQAIKNLTVQYPDLSLALFELIAQKLIEFKELLGNYLKKQLPRLAQYLSSLPFDQEKRAILIPISYLKLAKLMDMTPESLSRAMRKLKTAQVISSGGQSRLFLVNRERLNKIANGEERL
ncbi:MAG: Crp/Fnr family transcriptional regulator [Deltaproteobacteria bacterium]|jgi:CRP/FNR family transcriptional regulator|nr:Crp/Fnr family transcriptional regulator [Deltaproteobacteria bacterium]